MDGPALRILVLIVLCYLVGAVPFGYVVARAVAGIDIRERGSKNIGATNVARVCGRGWGVLVFVLDFLKGAGPALLAHPAVSPLLRDVVWSGTGLPSGPWAWTVAAGCGAGAILGHMFPVYLRFRGGKGVATAAGVFLVLAPAAAGIALAAWGLLAALFHYVSFASIVAAAALVAAQALLGTDAFGDRLPIVLLAAVMAALVIVRHASNIRRLLAGTETKIGAKRPPDAPPPAAPDPSEPPTP
jgi:glycerol-3-phosphate acyltransferase PlsY